VGFALELEELPARIAAGDSSNTTKAKKRSMQISSKTQRRNQQDWFALRLQSGAQVRNWR
jgi:hypothetical protein